MPIYPLLGMLVRLWEVSVDVNGFGTKSAGRTERQGIFGTVEGRPSSAVTRDWQVN